MTMKARILFFDIESTNLNGVFGHIICISWKFQDEDRVHTASIHKSPQFKKDPIDDSWVLEEFRKRAYEKCHVWVAHYGRRFDMRMIQARRLFHHLDPLEQKPSVDTWRIARDNLALHSNRLAALTDFLELPSKTPLSGEIWRRAAIGDIKSIKYVIEHCEADIWALEGAYNKLRPFMTTHPNVNLVPGNLFACPVCGNPRIVRDGYRIAKTGTAQIYKCLNCGSKRAGKYQKQKIRYEDFDYPR